MQTGIIPEPTPTLRAGVPPELRYRLDTKDLLAYWVFLCCHARHLLPRAARDALVWPMAAVPSIVGFVLGASISLAGEANRWPWRTAVGVGLVLLGFVASIGLSEWIKARPGLFLRPGKGLAPCRWLCLRQLAELAWAHANRGALDRAATWRFSMTAEGFTLRTERQETCAGVVTVIGKRIQGPWAVLEHVGGTYSHLFLTARDGTAFIVPHGDVPGDAFHDVIVTATRYHRAAVEGAAPPTGIALRVEQVQGASRPSEGITRPEDRFAQGTPPALRG